MEILAPSFKNSCFFRRTTWGFSSLFLQVFSFHHLFYYSWFHLFISSTLGFFVTVSSGVFISPLIFTIVFLVFSFHQLSLSWLFFLSGTSFLCYCTANATYLRKLFLLSGVFYLTLFPDIWHNGMLHQPAFIKASLEASSSSLKVAEPLTEVRWLN